MTDFAKIYVILAVSVVTAHTLSIGTVRDRNVTKRESDVSDVFPDFENQHRNFGESTTRRKRPVKRLALPANFLLRPVAESDGDDYYLSQAGGESGDNYENKDWSDIHRTISEDKPKPSNLLNLTDIEGVANYVNRRHNGTNEEKSSGNLVVTDNDSEDEILSTKSDDESKVNRRQSEPTYKEDDDNDDTDDDSSDDTTKTTETKEEEVTEETEKEKAEAEAKKKEILDAVDQLKARHVLEQRLISGRHNSDELFVEEHERDKISSGRINIETDKYSHPAAPARLPEYYEYPEYDQVEDKYGIHPMPRSTTTTTTTTTTERTEPTTMRNHKGKIENQSEGKLSVFKNPREYMIDIYDTLDEPGNTERKKVIDLSAPKRSSKYVSSTTDAPEENDRISFIPIGQTKKGEPALFIPKKRKPKRRKFKFNASQKDSTVAATVTDTPKDTNRIELNRITEPDAGSDTDNMDTKVTASADVGTITGPSGSSSSVTGPSGHPTRTTSTFDSSSITGPSASDKLSASAEVTSSAEDTGLTAPQVSSAGVIGLPAKLTTAADTSALDKADQSDAESAHSDKEEEKEPEDSEHEHGGDRSHHSEHHNSFGEGGKKAYEGYHEDKKAKKGHHDKESHSGEYQDAAGYDKEHHKENDHFGAHAHEEHGKKHAQYEESGKHSQGHSTKGSHDIHKKEEYEKKVEFFEEDGDSGEEEKAGGHHAEKKHATGGRFEKSSHDSDHKHFHKGDNGQFQKGGHDHAVKGRQSGAGHNAHGHQESLHHHTGGKQTANKWVYHHGFPAKTANLVIIDRRAGRHA